MIKIWETAKKPELGQLKDLNYLIKIRNEYTIQFYNDIGLSEKARLFKDFTNYHWLQFKIDEMKANNPTMYKVYKAVTEQEQTTNEVKDRAKVCQKTAENYLKLLTSSGLVKCNKIEWRGRHKYMFMWTLA